MVRRSATSTNSALFYLLARNIWREDAGQMPQIEVFIREVVELLEPAALREHLLNRLSRRLAALED